APHKMTNVGAGLHVAVVGAYGGLGKALVASLLDAGYTVTAIARNTSGRATLGDAVTVVEADVSSHAEVLSVFRSLAPKPVAVMSAVSDGASGTSLVMNKKTLPTVLQR
ncbi:unnamed protein product, partial [Polarella glacialis]